MCTLIFVYVLPIYGAECIYMLTHIFDRTRQKTRVLQRGFMPPALRAHVIIPVFRGAYAPRYEYAAPVGALFSAVNSAESPDPALRIHRSLWWGFIVVIELKLRNHWDIHCFLLAK